MNASTTTPALTPILTTDWLQRWEVYHRLQTLEIACECGVNQPLTVGIETPLDILQVWVVMRNIRSTRQELIDCLENCWQLPEKTQ
jgi:hypothetical protein